jgi:hypothetical protein
MIVATWCEPRWGRCQARAASLCNTGRSAPDGNVELDAVNGWGTMESMSRVLPLSALLAAGAVQAIVARSAPGGEPAAPGSNATGTAWVARFSDQPEPDAAPLGVPASSTARFGSGLDSDGPACASSILVASAGPSSQQRALARSVLLRFGSGLDGDVPACAREVRAVATPCSVRDASGNTACLRFGSGLEDSGLEDSVPRDRARAPMPNVLLESGL